MSELADSFTRTVEGITYTFRNIGFTSENMNGETVPTYRPDIQACRWRMELYSDHVVLVPLPKPGYNEAGSPSAEKCEIVLQSEFDAKPGGISEIVEFPTPADYGVEEHRAKYWGKRWRLENGLQAYVIQVTERDLDDGTAEVTYHLDNLAYDDQGLAIRIPGPGMTEERLERWIERSGAVEIQ